jgi:hypothetical protein
MYLSEALGLPGAFRLKTAFLRGLLDFSLGLFLFLNRRYMLSPLLVGRLFLAPFVANDALALVVRHKTSSDEVRQQTGGG